MKSMTILPCAASLWTVALAHGAWVEIQNFESLALSNDEAAISQASGMIYQDWDFYRKPECEQGLWDCTGVREIIANPYGDGTVLSLRGSPPDVFWNARSMTAFPIPEEGHIPLGGKATFYLKFAIESFQLSTSFGFTDKVIDPWVARPVPPADQKHEYGDLRVTTQMRSPDGVHQVYENFTPGWKPSLAAPLAFEPGVWYEIWWHVDNQAEENGGGWFDIYVKGGAFGETPRILPNIYLPAELIAAGITQWNFRSGTALGPITRFLNAMGTGTTDEANPAGTGAAYFDDIYVYPGEYLLDAPTGDTPPKSFFTSSVWYPFPNDTLWSLATPDFIWVGAWPFVYNYSGGGSWWYVFPGSEDDGFFFFNFADSSFYWGWKGLYSADAPAWIKL